MDANGSTALYDAINTGMQLMLKLYATLHKLDRADEYQFINIILTDGDENASKTTMEELVAKMALIGLTIPTRMLK